MDIREIIKAKNNQIYHQLEEKPIAITSSTDYLHAAFDQDAVSKKCFEKGFNDPNDKYYQMTQQMILESWSAKGQESCKYGNMLDSYADKVLNESQDLDEWKLNNAYEYDSRLKGLCDGFNQFYNMIMSKTTYRYVTREEKMYVKSNKSDKYLNGRFDCLFYSAQLDRYLLIDWKTSGKIDKENKWEKMYGPLHDKDACNHNYYTIQVLMYKKALCETYGITDPSKIDVLICQFTPEKTEAGTNYTVYNPAFQYDSSLLDDIIDFAYAKKALRKRD